MKKLFAAVMLAVTLIGNISVFADKIYREDETFDAPKIEAGSAMLLDMKTGRIIYSKNSDEMVYPASTTKILTGILALELGNLSDTVTASVAALAPITHEDSHMGILIGETLTMEQLINGMLVYSANDAANVLATHISGTSEQFVKLMNEKAAEIGATNTHFTNTYGIHDDEHYTTAEDLAKIALYAMKNEKFREIVAQKSYTIPATNKYKERILPATNLFLGTSRSFKYGNNKVTGIKTGRTNAAGHCLVASAVDGDTELLSVVMKASSQDFLYSNTNALFDYGFKNYTYQSIVKSGDVVTDSKVIEAKDDERVAFTVTDDVSALLPTEIEMKEAVETKFELPPEIKAPIKKGDILGTVTYSYKGQVIGESTLMSTNDVERNILLFIFNRIVMVLTSPFFYIPAILLLIIYIIRLINVAKQEKLRRKRRLHSKANDRVVRTGTKSPINSRFEDTTKYRRRR